MEPRSPPCSRCPAPPVIAGDGSPGTALTCTPGTWLADDPGAFLFQAPQSTSIQWTLDGTDIPGATATTYTPGVTVAPTDAGRRPPTPPEVRASRRTCRSRKRITLP
jgi:hypothetical protein